MFWSCHHPKLVTIKKESLLHPGWCLWFIVCQHVQCRGARLAVALCSDVYTLYTTHTGRIIKILVCLWISVRIEDWGVTQIWWTNNRNNSCFHPVPVCSACACRVGKIGNNKKPDYVFVKHKTFKIPRLSNLCYSC